MERGLACLSALPHLTVSKREGKGGYQHKSRFLALHVFLILSQSGSKQLWGECGSLALGRMWKSCCALSWLWTQQWLALTCSTVLVQLQVLERCKCYKWGWPKPLLSQGILQLRCLHLCYKGFSQNPFFSKETQHNSLTHHKVQIRITFLDNEPDTWPQAQLLGLPRESCNSLAICPEHTVERGKWLLPI